MNMTADGVGTTPDSSKKICFVIEALGPGGAERVISLLAMRWVAAGWHVTVCSFDGSEDRVYHAIDPRVKLLRLGRAGEKRNLRPLHFAKRIIRLRHALLQEQPHLTFSFLTKINAQTLLATLGTAIRVIACERNNPVMQNAHPLWNGILPLLLRRAAAYVVQTNRALQHAPASIRTRALVIPNPIEKPDLPEREQSQPPYRLVAVGRLTAQKGFDLLIDAFERSASRHSDWVLDIFGDGDEATRLQAQIATSHLSGRVTLRGTSARQGGWAQDADAFVLASRWEGFPNVLGEAMACGLPVIAFDCAFGPREMIQHGYDGLLIERENVAALARALDRIMSDAGLRHTLGQNAQKSSRRFAPDHVAKLWDDLVRRMTVKAEATRATGSPNKAPTGNPASRR